jgi:hypothetical protein
MEAATKLLLIFALPVTLGIAASFFTAFVLDIIGDAGDGPTAT